MSIGATGFTYRVYYSDHHSKGANGNRDTTSRCQSSFGDLLVAVGNLVSPLSHTLMTTALLSCYTWNPIGSIQDKDSRKETMHPDASRCILMTKGHMTLLNLSRGHRADNLSPLYKKRTPPTRIRGFLKALGHLYHPGKKQGPHGCAGHIG